MGGSTALLALLLLGVLVLVWQWLQAMGEHALRVARKACADANLQLLDMTVTLDRLRFARQGRRVGWRLDYRFDVSRIGNERLHGRLRFFAGELDWIDVPGVHSEHELLITPLRDSDRH